MKTPNAVVVPEGEIWYYELHYQFNAGHWGDNTRPEVHSQTQVLFNTTPKVTINHFTGAYGGPISGIHTVLALTRVRYICQWN